MAERRSLHIADEPLAESSSQAHAKSLADRVRALKLPKEVRRRPSRWPWVALLLIVAGTAAAYFGGPRLLALLRSPSADQTAKSNADNSTSKAVPPSSTASPSLPAEATDSSSPVKAAGELVLEYKGYIVPAHQILVSPKVNGMIMRLNIEEGRRVAKGEMLAELESVDYAADVARAKALLAAFRSKLEELERGNRPEEIAQAKAELAEAQATRDQAYLTFKRNVGLRGTKVVSESDYEISESNYKAAEQRVIRLTNSVSLMVEGPRAERIAVAKAEVGQAEADLAKAEWRLSNCQILAPISGTILKKNAEEGNIVNPIAFNGSYSLCEMADLSDLEIDLSIQERDISHVHVGQKCQIRSEAYPKRVYDGVVSRLMPIADRAKGAVPVRVKVRVPSDEEGVYLKPEMGAVVSFLK